MPAGVVKQGEESKWAKAKKLAAQQGHAKDWPYINGIFQKMKGGDEAEKCLQKSELTPWARGEVGQPKFIISTWPGQVPSRMRLEEQKLAKEMAMPMPFHPAMLFNPGGTYLTPASVVDGLGFDRAQESEWRQYLGKAIQTPNELVLRQSILSKMLGDKLDAPRRRALFGRALSYYRDMRKSMVNVVTVDELRKSGGEGSRGGKVIGHNADGSPIYESKKAPVKNTWEYPDEQAARSEQMRTAMLGGVRSWGKSDTYGGIVDNKEQGDPEGRLARVKRVINNRVANAGPCGLPLDKLGDVVKAPGKKVVADVLTKACGKGGHLTFKKGALKFRG